ncbi:molybdopterin-binding protein [Desulfoluna spongiiphila]|uniref:Molybdopterin molybdenumtransferase n=1 Tax=Desulfoluna spongiiphila TaxID=419481 RepID=A0A1G5E2H1_9BACT|nr:molybdopterin-binding protein [Desulfoluna spongiiphila]SCY21209.1 molybdenum cofactor cytidylyltransferase [Desulfoluna spongiiphila]VVS91559.1 moab/mog domain [Desulfoluna spongiiphila]
MKCVAVEEAEGMVICHDMTRIIPGEYKGPAFKRGHIIQKNDIPELLNIGKANIYVYDIHNGLVHEDDAAERIANAAKGQGIKLSTPCEGKVTFKASQPGLLKINVDALHRINEIDDTVFSTLHTNQQVKKGQSLAGTRIIPLVTQEKNIMDVEDICRQHGPIIEIKPFPETKVGIVTTGSEIYSGRIEDKFGPVLVDKFSNLNSRVMDQVFVSDNVEMTVNAIHNMLEAGAELIAVTGGMSVDPDDQTPASIRAAGGEVIIYGSPILPGAMFMLAYIKGVPVVGLPGCVMYHKASIFDLVVPRILTGEKLTKADIIALGHGGFCSNCPECRYPLCSFGKAC